jgi:hypothetical protein
MYWIYQMQASFFTPRTLDVYNTERRSRRRTDANAASTFGAAGAAAAMCSIAGAVKRRLRNIALAGIGAAGLDAAGAAGAA